MEALKEALINSKSAASVEDVNVSKTVSME